MAVPIGAENEAPRAAGVPHRRSAHGVAELLDRRVGRDQVRRQRHEEHQSEHRDAEDGALVLAECGPEGGERRRLGENLRRAEISRGRL